MQPNAPIGIFDSGLGGLTVLKAIQERLPNESLLYFGDTAHLPYGDKSPKQVRIFAEAICRHLLRQNVKAIVIACNTASAAAYDAVRELAHPIPVIEVITPAVEAALSATKSGIVGVIGTKTTVASGTYTAQLTARQQQVQTIARATPLLVPLIEEGWLQTDVMRQVIATYLSPADFAAMDTLILGCTHYPIIAPVIAQHLLQHFPQPVAIVTAGPPTASALEAVLAKRNLLAQNPAQAKVTYQVSDLTPTFQALAQAIMAQPVQLEQVNPHTL